MRRFQIASPASWRPAFRPTRGSGLGAAADIGAGAAPVVVVAVDWAQAPAIDQRGGDWQQSADTMGVDVTYD